MPNHHSLIRTQDLSHAYFALPEPILALDEITLALERGEYVAVVGANVRAS